MELQRQPLPAKSSLLINYVSPWSIVSLFRSLAARHFPVSIAISGGFILKIAIIASTGLFALEEVHLTTGADFSISDKFNLTLGENIYEWPLIDAGMSLWAISTGSLGYPEAAVPEYASLSFTSDESKYSGTNVNLTAGVPTFRSEIDCTPFVWAFDTKKMSNRNSSLADILPQEDFSRLSTFYAFVPIASNENPESWPHLTNVSYVYLNNTFLVDYDHPRANNTPYRSNTAHVFTSVLVDWQNGRSTATALLCSPRYSVARRQVTTSMRGEVLAVAETVLDVMDQLLPPKSVLTSRILNSVMGLGLQISSDNFWIDMMNLTTPQVALQTFVEPDVLTAAFQTTFEAISVLAITRDRTSVPDTDREIVQGLITAKVTRLVIPPLALRVVEALLCLLVLASLSLCLFQFRPLYQQVPSLLATAAALASNSELEQALSRDPIPRLETLARGLDRSLLHSTPEPVSVQTEVDHVRSRTTDGTAHKNRELSPETEQITFWWLPTAASTVFRAVVFINTLGFVAILEALYQLSDKNKGLTDVDTTTYIRYVWLFLPAALTSALGLAYVAMDKATRTIHPFSELCAQKNNNLDTLVFDPNASVAPVAFIQALRRHRFGLSAITATSMLGAILTIVASGLYSTVPAQLLQKEALASGTWFDIESPRFPSSSRSSSGISEEMYNQAIQFYNLSRPAGTSHEFAFGTPHRSWLTGKKPSSKLTGIIPATRAQANCSLYDYRETFGTNSIASRNWDIYVTPPPGCTPGPNDRRTNGSWIQLGQPAGRVPNEGLFGFVSLLQWNLIPAAFNSDGSYSPANREPYTVCNDSTQHLFMVYGNQLANTTRDLIVLHCLPFVEAVDVEATFSLPSFLIDTTSPLPKVVGTPRPWSVSNKANNSIALPDPTSSSAGGKNWDSFFMTVTRGVDGVPPEELFGRSNVDKMIKRVNNLYQDLAAITLHMNYRVDSIFDTDSRTAYDTRGRPVPGTIDGTISTPIEGVSRLIQRGPSTRVLEGLLLCLAICAGLSFWLVGKTRVLPSDPGSIAAQMGLFAGSEIVSRMRRVGDGGKGLEGETLGLGWWGDGEEGEGAGKVRRRRYGIDVVAKEPI